MSRLEKISKKISRKLIFNWTKAGYVQDFLVLTPVKLPD